MNPNQYETAAELYRHAEFLASIGDTNLSQLYLERATALLLESEDNNDE